MGLVSNIVMVILIINQPYSSQCCEMLFKKTDDFLSFLNFICDQYDRNSIDIVYSLPTPTALEQVNALVQLLKLFGSKHLLVKMVVIDSSSMEHEKEQGNLRIILSSLLINTTSYLINRGGALGRTNNYVIIDETLTPWFSHLVVEYGTTVILAITSPDGTVEISQITSNNGTNLITGIGVWSPLYIDPEDLSLSRKMDEPWSVIYREESLAFSYDNDPPFVIYDRGPSGNITARGFVIDLWELINEKLRIDVEITVSNTKREGTYNASATVQWNGLIGESLALDTDLILAAVRPSKTLIGVYRTTNSFATLRLAIYQKIQPADFKDLFENEGIVSLVVCLLVFSAGVFTVFLGGGLVASDSAFAVLTFMLQQSSSLLPNCESSKMASISLAILSGFLIIVLLGDMISNMGTYHSSNYLGLEDLLHISGPIYVVKGSVVHNLLKENMVGVFKSIRLLIKEHDYYVPNITAGLEKVVNGDATLLEIAEKARYYLPPYERWVTESIIKQSRTPVGLLLKKEIQLAEAVDEQLLKLKNSGLVEQLTQKWVSESPGSVLEYSGVRLTDVRIVYLLSGAGVFIVIIIYLVELFYNRNTTKNVGTTNEIQLSKYTIARIDGSN